MFPFCCLSVRSNKLHPYNVTQCSNEQYATSFQEPIWKEAQNIPWGQKNQILMKDRFVHAQDRYFFVNAILLPSTTFQPNAGYKLTETKLKVTFLISIIS